MYLKKLYSEPSGLFEEISFKPGVNFIYAKKDNDTDSKNSLNGVGKSLLLNIIDYCLLSSETKHIKAAKEEYNLSEYCVVLEFEVNGKEYIIKRFFSTPNQNILFGEKNKELINYKNTNTDKEISKILCDIIFKDNNYVGKYSNTWLRKLIPFFIKNQSTKSKVNFKDPINYLHDNSKEYELIPLHLLLMGIDNTLTYLNSANCAEIKSKAPALREVESLVQEKYNLKDIPQAESEKDKIKSKIKTLQKNIDDFKLAEQYKDVEEQSNVLTTKIKELVYKNHESNRKMNIYEKSFKIDDDVSTIKIRNIYKDLNELLAKNVKKTLDEAIKFRKKISRSREKFLKDEIVILKNIVNKNEDVIKKLETERAKLFSFLESKEAIKDLSEAYLLLNKKSEEFGDLEGKIKIYRDLKTEVAEREAESAKLYAQIEVFAQKIQKNLTDFRQIFFTIHDAVYVESEGEADFIFNPNKNKDSKIDMNVILPSDLSYGKNKGRTLIYDLSILFHAIEKNIKCPKFLIHDGIFDGIDKAHFVYLYNYLKKLKDGKIKFQYLVTLNQDGEIKDKDFGDGAESLSKKKIEEESIIILKPSSPLFKIEKK